MRVEKATIYKTDKLLYLRVSDGYAIKFSIRHDGTVPTLSEMIDDKKAITVSNDDVVTFHEATIEPYASQVFYFSSSSYDLPAFVEIASGESDITVV